MGFRSRLRDLYRRLFCRLIVQEGFYQEALMENPQTREGRKVFYFGVTRHNVSNMIVRAIQNSHQDGFRTLCTRPMVKRSTAWYFPFWSREYHTGKIVTREG